MSIERNITNMALEKRDDEVKNPVKTEPQKPFDLDEALSDENVEAAKEDAEAEQQRKEAMTERD